MCDAKIIKDNTPVDINKGRLSVPMYVDNEINVKHDYSLRAVIIHTGPFKKGHYKTYFENRLKKWWLCNDRYTHQVKMGEIDVSNMYVLFYVRNS